MRIYAYFRYFSYAYLCIFLACLVLHIWCIFLHILICMQWHIYPYAYSSLFQLMRIQAYFSLHFLCLPRPIRLINIQTAAGFFRRPNFLSFNRPHTRLIITAGRLAYKGSAEGAAVSRSGVSVLATSSCLISSCNLDNLNWYWEHAPRPATLKTLCIRRCIRLFVVESLKNGFCLFKFHCTESVGGAGAGTRGEGRGWRRGYGEGCTCRCLARAHTHTHSLTLPAKAARAGALP